MSCAVGLSANSIIRCNLSAGGVIVFPVLYSLGMGGFKTGIYIMFLLSTESNFNEVCIYSGPNGPVLCLGSIQIKSVPCIEYYYLKEMLSLGFCFALDFLILKYKSQYHLCQTSSINDQNRNHNQQNQCTSKHPTA